MSIIIKSLDVSDSSQIARLHISGISTGFISSLGIDFVTALYEAIAESDASFGYVYRLENRIVGFTCFFLNTIGRTQTSA